MADSRDSIDQKIWQVVAAIPAGKVASYGQVAKAAGLARAPRRVSPALNRATDDMALPWHRVIRGNGELAFPEQHPNYQRQRQLLVAEGVLFRNKKVDLQRCRWEAAGNVVSDDNSLDAVLWG